MRENMYLGLIPVNQSPIKPNFVSCCIHQATSL
jgi:hypothetical protein